jgi:XRE family transcriptional regulator, regulator of sulfur utilization
MGTTSESDLASRLAANLRALRDGRGLTQAQLAKLSGVPRATLGQLESGVANPTLSVLHRVAMALQVPLEELIAAPKTATMFYPRSSIAVRRRGDASVRKLLPERIHGAEIDRIELPRGGRMTGVPHTPGTREFLTCEQGSIVLTASGETWTLHEGDVIAFRGDQKHAYANPGETVSVGWSVVLIEEPR